MKRTLVLLALTLVGCASADDSGFDGTLYLPDGGRYTTTSVTSRGNVPVKKDGTAIVVTDAGISAPVDTQPAPDTMPGIVAPDTLPVAVVDTLPAPKHDADPVVVGGVAGAECDKDEQCDGKLVCSARAGDKKRCTPTTCLASSDGCRGVNEKGECVNAAEQATCTRSPACPEHTETGSNPTYVWIVAPMCVSGACACCSLSMLTVGLQCGAAIKAP